MLTLVLGGARSGKSRVAERLAAAMTQPVTYVATMRLGDDPELVSRVEVHRSRRPASWRTVETGDDLSAVLLTEPGTVLLDALGGWVAARPDMEVDIEGLCRALESREGDTVVVSEEVGLGVHPSTEAGRRFRDALGVLNQAVAEIADEVLLVVSGRVLHLDRSP